MSDLTLKKSKIAHVWKEGMAEWKELSQVQMEEGLKGMTSSKTPIPDSTISPLNLTSRKISIQEEAEDITNKAALELQGIEA